jgi:AraC-like DNA-binding protein
MVQATAAVAEWNFPRGAASVLLMTRFAEEHGVSAADVLRGSAISAEAAADPETQLDAHQELAVVRNLVRHLGDLPALGLQVGCRYRLSTFGIFGFACLSCPTLRDVITFALRYWDLSFAFGIPAVQITGDQVRIELQDDGVPQDVRQFVVERDLAAMFTVMRELLPVPIRLQWQEFRFAEPPPDAMDAYVDVFGVRPRFGAPANTGGFDGSLLDHPLPQANPLTVAQCEATCRELVARKRARTGLSNEVRARLIRLDGVDVGMDAIARELHLSTRTLRRRLGEAGTSYRELLDEVREALAEELLATGALSVSDVAIRLGYAEATSFIYAFRRWKGETPAVYAQKLRQIA